MESALSRFGQYLKLRFNQSSTAIHYFSDVKIFLETLGEKQLEQIGPADIDVFIDEQISGGLNPATINRRLTSVYCFFEFLAQEGKEHARVNPVVRRRHTLRTVRHLPRDASDEDVARLFAAIEDVQDKAMFSLMFGAGLRVTEVSTLCLSDLDNLPATDGMIRIRLTRGGSNERIAWIAGSPKKALLTWLRKRPSARNDRIFLNRFGNPITSAGIRYRLRKYNKAAEITVSCRQLRHTYARRLVEGGLPVESLAHLMGHRHLKSAQRYIEGANPAQHAGFVTTMGRLETTLIRDTKTYPLPDVTPLPPRLCRNASIADLDKLRPLLRELPPWLALALDEYLHWRWPTWREQTAYRLGRNTVNLVRRIWSWLDRNRSVDSWETLRRSDLEAWLISRHDDNVTKTTIRNDLAQLQSVFRFLELRDYPLDPGLFRVRPPKLKRVPLPRYLTEADYGWLEINVLQATREETYDACFDRAWFLTLAHTGLRLSEMLDLRLADLNIAKGAGTVRGGKQGRDRVIYLTPSLRNALARYLHFRPNIENDDHIFILHQRAPTPRTIQRRLAKYGKQIGVEVSPHRLRHTFATRLLNQGMPLFALRKLLGHQDISTTKIYARIHDETLIAQYQEAMSRLETLA